MRRLIKNCRRRIQRKRQLVLILATAIIAFLYKFSSVGNGCVNNCQPTAAYLVSFSGGFANTKTNYNEIVARRDHSFIYQLFTEVERRNSPCKSVLRSGKTKTLDEAREWCVHTAGCNTFDRNHYDGLTYLCASSYRDREHHSRVLINLWVSSDIGGCHDLNVFPEFRVSGSKSNCSLLGLQHFQFQPLLDDVKCRASATYSTHSLQDASMKCLAKNCWFYIREASGSTTFCGDPSQRTHTSALTAIHKDIRRIIATRVGGNMTDENFFRSQVRNDVPFGLNAGKLECSRIQILMPDTITSSLQHATSICAAEPHCTCFSRQDATEVTQFCQGFISLDPSPYGNPTVSGIAKGCEVYKGEPAFADIASSNLPFCKKSDSGCSGELFEIPLHIDGEVKSDTHIICDECQTYGLCPRLPSVRRQEHRINDDMKFTDILEDVANLIVSRNGAKQFPLGAINPSIFSYGSRYYVVSRVSNALRCNAISKGNTWQVDSKQALYESHILLCQTSSDSLLPIRRSCKEIRFPLDIFVENMEGWKFDTKSAFLGPEDPRGFSFDGKIMLLCNIGVEQESNQGYHGDSILRHVFLLVLDNYSVERAIRLEFGTKGNNKNVVPVIGEGVVYLIFSVLPYKICRLSFDSGHCTEVDLHHGVGTHVNEFNIRQAEATVHLNKLGKWSGSTPFVHTPFGFLGIIHRKQDLELGRVYTHKWVILDARYPHVPIFMSKPFRFPKHHHMVDDIQFASGLIFDESARAVVVSYGVSDCISMIDLFEPPFDELLPSLGHPGEQFPALKIISSVPRVRQRTESYLIIRWDGPVTDLSSFAMVARQVCAKLINTAGIKLIIRNLGDGTEFFDPYQNHEIYSRIISSNEDLAESPDIVIRFHWPPNFQPIPHGKLIIYLPWEFFHIPKSWVRDLNSAANEVWVPSAYVKEGFEGSGVIASKIHVVPHGVSCAKCKISSCAEEAKFPVVQSSASIRLLYHGGALRRKGLDLVLQAYHIAFHPKDDVVLVIHSVYGEEDMFAWVKDYLRKFGQHMAEVEILREKLTKIELEDLYQSSDLLIHLSRSEGFGMGIIEAMAQGLPVLVPETPPMTDFVTEKNGFIIPSSLKVCNVQPCFDGGRFFKNNDWEVPNLLLWHEYDIEDAAQAMKDIYHDSDLLSDRRRQAKQDACNIWSWTEANHKVMQRIEKLAETQYWKGK